MNEPSPLGEHIPDLQFATLLKAIDDGIAAKRSRNELIMLFKDIGEYIKEKQEEDRLALMMIVQARIHTIQ